MVSRVSGSRVELNIRDGIGRILLWLESVAAGIREGQPDRREIVVAQQSGGRVPALLGEVTTTPSPSDDACKRVWDAIYEFAADLRRAS